MLELKGKAFLVFSSLLSLYSIHIGSTSTVSSVTLFLMYPEPLSYLCPLAWRTVLGTAAYNCHSCESSFWIESIHHWWLIIAPRMEPGFRWHPGLFVPWLQLSPTTPPRNPSRLPSQQLPAPFLYWEQNYAATSGDLSTLHHYPVHEPRCGPRKGGPWVAEHLTIPLRPLVLQSWTEGLMLTLWLTRPLQVSGLMLLWWPEGGHTLCVSRKGGLPPHAWFIYLNRMS